MTANTKQNNLQQWLQSINCLQSFTQNDILNGMVIYNIISHISTNHSASLKQLSTSTSTLSRVSNWNILSQQLKKYNIIVNQQNKNKIVNGNQQLVVDIISQLKQYHSKKQKSSQVDLAQIDAKKDPNDSKSLLQLLLILMMKNFHLSAKQAVALLSNQSKYLAHILTKGLKGQFKPIQTFLIQLSKSLQKIVKFCEINQQNIVFFLRSIKPSLISKSQSVSLICLEFFNKFMLNYNGNQRISIFDTHLLSTYMLTIKRHPHMETDVVISMLDTIVGNQINKQNQKVSKSSLKNKQHNNNTNSTNNTNSRQTKQLRQKVLNLIFSSLSSQTQKYNQLESIIKIFGQINKLQQLMQIQYFSKQIKRSVQLIKDQQYNLTCINILILLNQYLPQLFSSQHQSQSIQKYHCNPNQLAQLIIQNLKSIQFPSHPITFANQLFTLLNYFGSQKHFIAPSLYKLIVLKFTQIQNIQSDLYQVYINNFIQTIKQFPSIPWNNILQIIINRKKQQLQAIQMNQIQLQFFYFILKLENIDIKTSLIIYDIISKTFMQTYHLAGHITKLIQKIVDSFIKTQSIVQQLTIKLIKVCLAIHHANTKKLLHKRKSLTGPNKPTGQQALMKIKNHSIQNLILKLVQLKTSQINSKVQPLVAFSYIQMKDKPQFVKGFKNILQALGNFNQTIQKYQKQIKKAQQEAKQQQKLQKEKLQKQKQKMSSSKIVSKVHSKSRYDQQNIDSARKQDSFAQDHPNPLFPQTKGQSMSVHTSSFNRSYLGITPSAQKGIQKFQKVYLSKIQKQDFQKIRKQQQQQRFEMMKKLYRKKMMSNGIQIKGQTDNIQYLFQFDSQQNTILQKHFLKIPYYSNQNQEERDMMAVQRILKSYQKSLKLIFSIYSGRKNGQLPQNFDQIAQKNVIVNSSALYKLLKDYGFQDYVTLKQVQYLTQKVNIQLNPQTADYQILDFDGFIQFIKQVSFLMFTRPPKDLRGHPLAMMLQQTLSNLKLFAAQNKINQQIFQQPANIFFNQTQAVAQLNKKLAKNPDYILPQGYKKIVQKKITFQYGIFLQAMSPTYKVVFEVVDWLLNKALGVHVIQPFTKQQKVTKARPALFVAERLKIDAMPARHIPINMKRQIMKMPIKSRPDGKQCAIALDDIITAIQLGHNEINQKHLNKLEQQRIKQLQQVQKQQQIDKRRRQNRNRQAKTAIQQYKIKKQQRQKQQSIKKAQQQKKQKEQKQKRQKQQAQLKKKLEQYNKKKKQQQEQKLKKKKQQEQKQKKQRQRLKQLNEQTKKKIQQEKKKKEQQENNKKLEKQKEQKKLKQLQKKKLSQSQTLKKKMVEEFKLKKSQIKDNSINKSMFKQQKKNLQSLNNQSEVHQ